MQTSLICGTDLSDSAREAVDFAALLACSAGARLSLVHVGGAKRAGQSDLDEALQRERARCQQARPGLECETSIAEGEAWLRLPEIARAEEASLIVVGRHGKGSQGAGKTIRGALLGATADRLVRYGGHPVLVVPSTADTGSSLEGATWAVGVDFGETGRRALSVAVDWAERTKGEPWLVYVGPPKGSADLEQSDLDWERATEERLRQSAEQHAGGAAYRLWSAYGYPADGLEEAAESVGARVVVLGSHGRRGMPRFFLGSTAERMVHRSRRPVLVVGPASE